MSGKQDWEDDGRTIADMSSIERPRLLLPRLPGNRSPQEQAPAPGNPHEEPFSARERFMAILGAMGASLLIAAVFMIGFAIMILIMLRLWT